MHEWAIADNLVRLVTEAARKENLAAVSRVVIKVGALRQVIPETLETAFEMLAGETEIAGARLVTETVPLEVRCRSCGETTAEGGILFTCAHCAGGDLEILSGKELYIDYIEGERKDVKE
ncbi:MAG: hydrogenase maturation nickel metallochaperone HypA [PVC group bacterium]